MPTSKEIYWVRKRLIEWGNWCYHIVTMGLGYSSRSLLSQIQQACGIVIQGTAKALFPTNAEAEEMDTLVEKLAAAAPEGAGRPEWAKIVKIHYTLHKDDNKLKIQASGLTRATYYRYLEEAQIWFLKQLKQE